MIAVGGGEGCPDGSPLRTQRNRLRGAGRRRAPSDGDCARPSSSIRREGDRPTPVPDREPRRRHSRISTAAGARRARPRSATSLEPDRRPAASAAKANRERTHPERRAARDGAAARSSSRCRHSRPAGRTRAPSRAPNRHVARRDRQRTPARPSEAEPRAPAPRPSIPSRPTSTTGIHFTSTANAHSIPASCRRPDAASASAADASAASHTSLWPPPAR